MTSADYDPPESSDDPRVCRKCAVLRRAPGEAEWWPIQNTRTGRYHSGGEFGLTDCGVDATGDGWLWPL